MNTLVSDDCLKAIRNFEGCRLEAYQCSAGKWTIGYGHTRGVRRGDKISPYTAEEYLKQDVKEATHALLGVYKPKTIGQLDALVDFVFNLGIGNFKKSTLFRLLKEGRGKYVIASELTEWVYAGGKKLSGLVKRRQWEAERYLAKSRELTDEDIKLYLEVDYA